MQKILFLIVTVWWSIVAVSLGWNILSARQEQLNLARKSARSIFNQIIITRLWNARYGGVYVEVTDQVKPNKYLHHPLRDITVNDQLSLTRINPAYMTRQISDISRDTEDIQFHITSLNPIRPENRATENEISALLAFADGTKETGKLVTRKEKELFFYMAPLYVQEECLQCHGDKGYAVGDVIGGISITLPFVPHVPLFPLFIGHLILGFIGVAGLLVAGKKLNHAYETIKHQAAIDALTGIPNRRSFSERILCEYRRFRRQGGHLSIIMCDVDNFKAYNDTYGHKEGDNCLKNVAQALKNTMKRPADFCARYGGEEFIVILPDTDENGALQVAERIRDSVENLKITHEKSLPIGVVTISLGVATGTDEKMPGQEELIKRADDALYLAKNNGRNRVERG
jgi:diguanylate cyclase (GGDEF)-like protein